MKTFKISTLIISSIIGAGFASGKEIFEYFGKFGIWSLIFIIPLFFLMYFFILILLKFGHKVKNKDIKVANRHLCKNYTIFNKKFNLINLILCITFLILCSAMFSALIALFDTYFPHNSKIIGYFFAIFITIILLDSKFVFLEKISNILIPLIILCLVLNIICSIPCSNFTTNFGITNITPLPILSVLYASQNAFFSSFLITNLGKNLNTKEQKRVSIYTSGIVCLLISLGIICFLLNPELATKQMPFVEIAIKIHPFFSIIYSFILLISILTTYSTSLASLKEYLNLSFSEKEIKRTFYLTSRKEKIKTHKFKNAFIYKNNKPKLKTSNKYFLNKYSFKSKKHNSTFIMLVLIAFLSLLNFGKIIEYLYPLIGLFGVFYIFKIYNSFYSNNYESFNLKKKIKNS